jgi:DNA replication protein DnaC
MNFSIALPPGFKESTEKCACGNLRWVLPSGDIQDTCPDCQMVAVDAENTRAAHEREYVLHVTKQYAGYTWDSCQPESRSSFAKVKAWVDAHEPGHHLMLVGTQGSGKTCAARLAAWELWKKGAVTFIVTMNDYYQAYLNRTQDGPLGADARELLYYADNATVLVIDEFGFLNATDAAKQFFRSLHVRYHDSGTKSMVIISNFGRDRITEYFDASRLSDKSWTVVGFNGPDMRPIK